MKQVSVPSNAMATAEFKSLLDQCVRCGLCLQACPTFVVLKIETDSPRGRIQLMQAASEGRIGLNGAFNKHLTLCLACRACETACPSGVQYGALYERARQTLEGARRPGPVERLIRWLLLWQVLPHPRRLTLAARLLRLYQQVRLQALVRRTHLLPKRLEMMEALLPPLSADHLDYARPAPAIGPKQGTVAFFRGCVQDALLSRINAATVRVLQQNGYAVHVPAGQTCCGAAQLHVGEEEYARRLARQNIDAFGEGQYDAIVNNAGGCGAALKDYAHLFRDDPEYRDKARRFVERVQDLSEFLSQHLNRPPRGEVRARVTYADSCHLRHVQKVVQPPRDLIRRVPGVELVELQAPDRCCGSAGVYNIVQADTANEILDLKMADIAATGADIVVTTNTGCHLQLVYGVRKAGPSARVLHLAELLDESYRREADGQAAGRHDQHPDGEG